MSSKMKPIFFTKKLKNPALVLFLFTFLNAKQETIQVTTKNIFEEEPVLPFIIGSFLALLLFSSI